MLAREVAAQYGGRVTFVVENFGASALADRFGVKGYPAVFVDDVLVASPREFGYFGEVEGAGRYAPWRNAESQARFKADLVRMVDLLLAGRKDLARREHPFGTASAAITALPKIALTDLAGRALATGDLAGRAVLVEFWATWCPPCRSTLEWLGRLKQDHGDRLAVLALAVESPEAEVRTLAGSLSPDLRWAIADAPTAQAFGDITAVPTLFLFGLSGEAVRTFYGAPPDLHEQVERSLAAILE